MNCSELREIRVKPQVVAGEHGHEHDHFVFVHLGIGRICR